MLTRVLTSSGGMAAACATPPQPEGLEASRRALACSIAAQLQPPPGSGTALRSLPWRWTPVPENTTSSTAKGPRTRWTLDGGRRQRRGRQGGRPREAYSSLCPRVRAQSRRRWPRTTQWRTTSLRTTGASRKGRRFKERYGINIPGSQYMRVLRQVVEKQLNVRSSALHDYGAGMCGKAASLASMNGCDTWTPYGVLHEADEFAAF